ncbi:BOP1NT domain protein [Dictyocaulus viviparus]|uniref:Ribosome biogenesis protein BOP1 homolog n=1 Tax=Dictyocaulus viviparus TaxID=29172 RepID=A0A0D8Y4D8_DICVI|nr:BOP1NT domain protein [Dictyocaulus viviparus]
MVKQERDCTTSGRKRKIMERDLKEPCETIESLKDAKVEGKVKKNDGNKEPDEYDYDSSDEEDLRNTIGNIPVSWYDDENHIGYDQMGEKIVKPKKKTEIDRFLEKMEDPDYWRKVFDRQSGTDVVLTDEQVEKLNNIASGKYPIIGYNPYEPFLDLFSSAKTIHPIDNRPEPKARFIPSRDEMRIVSRMIHSIKMGWMKRAKPKEEKKMYDLWAGESSLAHKTKSEPEPKARFIPSRDEMRIVSRMIHSIKMGWMKRAKPKEEKKMYDLWAGESSLAHKTKSELARMRMHMPAPKMPLPTHAESYNPSEEYLFDEDEKQKWEETDPEDRCIQFMPQKYDALRKLQVDPTDLLPDLPNPNDLRPFPTTLAFRMHGHIGQVRSISIEPDRGELLVSGGEDSTVRVWMISSGKCLKMYKMGGPVTCVAFCPVSTKTLILVAYEGRRISIININCGDKLLCSQTEKLISEVPIEESQGKINWRRINGRITLEMPNEIRQVVWHAKGDYFASVAVEDIASSVYIHQMSKAKSQCPFTKRKGHVQSVAFHPSLPRFFVATKIHVRVYDLARCRLVKKYITGIKHICSIIPDIHGDNLFLGGLDRRFVWLDLQLSAKPWKSFKHQNSAIRALAYHKRYPLLSTASDDGTAMVYYARIHVDSFRDNEIYPVKRLRAHDMVDGLSVLSTVWHPTQAWLITAGADGTIALFSY